MSTTRIIVDGASDILSDVAKRCAKAGMTCVARRIWDFVTEAKSADADHGELGRRCCAILGGRPSHDAAASWAALASWGKPS